MSSPFDPGRPDPTLESKIVAALDRLSMAFRVLLSNEGRTYGLSPIQVQILLFIRFHEKKRCKVGVLSQEFNLTKATVSESIRTLVKKELVYKEEDATDGRSQVIGLTPEGHKAATHAADFALAIEQPLATLQKPEKELLLSSLLKLIQTLNRSGIITVQRMCLTCAHHQHTANGHYCKLMKAPLKARDLRLDCPDHKVLA